MFIEEATGKKIGQREARELKDAILGRYIDPSAYNHSEVSKVLQKYSLDLTPEQARDIVFNSVIPTLEVALKGINEACDLARKMRVPVIVHNSAPSMHKLAEVAPQVEHFLIAAHSNHTTFEAEEAVEHAMYLRRCVAIIDISTFDLFTGKRFADSPEIFFDMLKAKTVDTISTDWGGGFYDPILLGLQRSVEKGIITIPQAVYLSSGNVARNIPGLAPKRGSITKGFIADLVITEPQNLSKVRHVLIGGAFYVKNGELV
jgi:imidazolonepropionase-like amidohydrolase